MNGLRDERYSVCSYECLGETSEHRQVGVELHAGEATDAERGESVIDLQACELALNGGAATVEVAEPLRVTRDARKEPSARRNRHDRLPALCAAERNDRLAAALLDLRVHAGVVVSLVSGHRFGLEAARTESVEKRGDEVGFLTPRRLDLPREGRAPKPS
jgi:hypothetical protein